MLSRFWPLGEWAGSGMGIRSAIGLAALFWLVAGAAIADSPMVAHVGPNQLAAAVERRAGWRDGLVRISGGRGSSGKLDYNLGWVW